ncbi:MAG: hypothetical protein ACKO47_02240 [Alphaproteobacteria bacterium]
MQRNMDQNNVTIITSNQIFAELEDLLRKMPSRCTIHQNLDWFGRATAIIKRWDATEYKPFSLAIKNIQGRFAWQINVGFNEMMRILNYARHDLRLKTIGPLSQAIDQGSVFDYFDEIRKKIETAKKDVLFVDPYLDAEFVSRYLPHVTQGVKVRLLACKKLSTLMPAVQMIGQQKNLQIEIRSAEGFHDRYMFIDNQECYQSGSSFKDGAKKSPTTLTQITDAFPAVLEKYNKIWSSASIKSPLPA